MQPLKTVLRQSIPKSVRAPFENAFAAWKSRKYASARRAEQLLGHASAEWRQRIEDALACEDNAYIPRVPDAGKLIGGRMTMHNGVVVGGLSYCGAGMMNLLVENRGVHEPQEERAFGDVLKLLKPGGAMLELGAYWGFYSLWFAKEIPGARCFLVEPHPANIRSGKQNFKMNNRSGVFHRAYVGANEKPAADGTPTIAVDDFCERNGVKQLAILHADIQGAEADMLHGARRMLADHRIDYAFVSTHSSELHDQCVERLECYGYTILASANLDESYSVDGVIVARRPGLAGPDKLPISKRPKSKGAIAA